MVRLDHLVQELGSKVHPVGGYWQQTEVSRRELSGVHISELEDPTPYLEGAEFLLTTGMGWLDVSEDRPPGQIEAYVERLVKRGVAGLALSLGPHAFAVPAELADSCRANALPLFTVPATVPFLSISRTYWDLVAAAGVRSLTNALSTQASLTRAATGPSARAEIVKVLAQQLDGWVALLPNDTSTPVVWPTSASIDALHLRRELARLNMAGPHSAATFKQGSDAVVSFPIAVGRQVTGFLTVGLKRRLSSVERHVVLSACGLLALESRQRVTATGRAHELRAAIVHLLLVGHDVAARDLTNYLGFDSLPSRVRVTVVGAGGMASDKIRPMLELATGGAIWVDTPWQMHANGVSYFLTDAASPNLESYGDLPSGVWCVQSRGCGLAEVAVTAERARAERALGKIVDLSEGQASRAFSIANRVFELLSAPGQEPQRETVQSFLRFRGRWEEISKDLDLHRNTVRNRMSAIRILLSELESEAEIGADGLLDDPDVSAHLWILLGSQSR